ncbi:peptidase inhibitor family I36 protein [Streptomyces sp. NBC_01023]|uniref:peptidase inhibitor family I36 protein n=1 Tax=Streptomyces sp. NBC_01023 TaxID=2903724 RepID=UPI00386F4690|nr:peptidase inhibitor family I36 protein [Streptomyces sp. NBC_01023]
MLPRTRVLRRVAVSLATAASLIWATAGVGTAEAASHHSPAATSRYASQAKAFGLNTKEAATLQRQVDHYLSTVGGTQVAANRIQVPAGTLVLPLPGVKYASNSATPTSTKSAQYRCDYGHFCAFTGTNYTGTVFDMYNCVEQYISWMGNGSWVNNQTTGTQAQFKSSDHVTRWTDPGAYDWDDVADWTWVWYVKPC